MEITNLKAYLYNMGLTFVDFGVIVESNPLWLSRIASGKAYASRRLARDVYQATGGVIQLKTRPLKSNPQQEKQQQS